MARPDDRPLRRLPTLEADKDTLERCVFCPKLCRTTCPVSNVEPRETLTPWGKMSMAYFVARGDVPKAPSYAAPAWACTGCGACKTRCDHRNDVTSTLLHARAALVGSGVAPKGASQALARFARHDAATTAAVRELSLDPHVSASTGTELLLGCAYSRGAPAEARDAIAAASALTGVDVSLAEGCCGLPLLHAGDDGAFRRHAARFAAARARAGRLLVADAGCAQALRVRYPEHGITLATSVELVVELAARNVGLLGPVPHRAGTPVRYHDPCQLGRGLGVYDEPRDVLRRALGRAPDEFTTAREQATCAGGGGLLPATMPEVARDIAAARVAEHEAAGGGRIVTACASSLLMMRRRTRAPVDDIHTWIARSARGATRP